jgi:hypothetical protein
MSATPVPPPGLTPPPPPPSAPEVNVARPAQPSWPAEPPRAMRVVGTWLLALLAASAVATALFAVYTLAEVRVLQRAVAGVAVTDAEMAAAVMRVGVVAFGGLVLGLATAAVFFAWFHRGYHNLRSIGTTAPRFGTGWAVGGWFVPFLNLVRPKQIADELWRASRPGGASLEGPGRTRMFTVHLWWTLWVGAGAVQLYFAIVTFETAAEADPQALLWAAQGRLVGIVSELALHVLTFALVYGITVGQDTRIARLMSASGAPPWKPTPAAPLGAATGTLLLLAVLTLPITPAVLSAEDIAAAGIRLDGETESETDAGPAEDVPATEQRPAPPEDASGAETAAEEDGSLIDEDPDETTLAWIADLEAGDCFDELDPGAANVDEVTRRPCTEPHENEVFAVVDLPTAGEVRYDEEQVVIDSEQACEGAFEGYVGIPYDDSALWLFLIYPDRSAWHGGDRVVTCALYDGAGSPLVGSMADSGR